MECIAHRIGKGKVPDNKDGLIDLLRILASEGAIFLTNKDSHTAQSSTVATPLILTPELQTPLAPLSPATPAPTRRRRGFPSPVIYPEFPDSPTAEEIMANFSTPVPRGHAEEPTAHRKLPPALLESLQGPYSNNQERRLAFKRKQGVAVSVILNHCCLEYDRYALIIGTDEPLIKEDFANIQVAVFLLLTWILADMCKIGLEAEHRIRQERSASRCSEGWPFYTSIPPFAADACFGTRGHCSITGMVHVVTFMTSFVVAVHHMSKKPILFYSREINEKRRHRFDHHDLGSTSHFTFDAEHFASSGNMDPVGTTTCLDQIEKMAPPILLEKGAMVIVDGDVQKAEWEKSALWGLCIALCWTHWLKNYFKYLNSSTGMVKVKCTTALCGSCANSSKGHRVNTPIATRMHKWAAGSLKQGEHVTLMYLDEIEKWEGKLPSVESPEFAEALVAGRASFADSLDIGFEHYTHVRFQICLFPSLFDLS